VSPLTAGFGCQLGEEGGHAQVEALQMGEEVSSMRTSTQKIRAHWHRPVLFSCNEVGGFCTRISPLGGI